QRGGAAPGAAAVGMNARTPFPADTAEARSARRSAKAARKHERAQERAETRRARRAAAQPAGGGPGQAGIAQPAGGGLGQAGIAPDDAAAQEQGSALTRLRDSTVELWSRRIHPVLDVVSPIGWAVAAVAVFCWIVGLRFNVTELNVLAFALSAPMVIAALFVLGKASYRVTLDLQTHRVVVGTRAVGRVEVANPTRRTLLPSRIELAVGAATAQFMVPRLPAEESHEELFAVPTRRRAVLVVGPVRWVREDSLSVMRRQVTWARPQELF